MTAGLCFIRSVMSIIKIQKRDSGFVMIDNKVICDPKLSWKAKGILVYLLSKPNDWQVQITDIVNHSPDGESSVRSAIAELIEAGYMTRTEKQNKDKEGHWATYDYTVYESPYGGFPYTENPCPENHPLSNKEITNTEITNIREEGDNLQTSLETIIGIPAIPSDVKGMNELVSLNVNEDDIRGALAWRIENNLPPVKRLSQIFEGIKTNRNMRVQSQAARKNGNGSKPKPLNAIERRRLRLAQEAEAYEQA